MYKYFLTSIMTGSCEAKVDQAGDSTYILVVGGTDAGDGKSVEMLNTRGNAWVDGEKSSWSVQKPFR